VLARTPVLARSTEGRRILVDRRTLR
jgi:hypothetical protein